MVEEMDGVIARIWSLADAPVVTGFLSAMR
jgi:hypothetical protein